MEYNFSTLSHEEVQEAAEYIGRFVARRRDDAEIAFSAKNQDGYERALVEWKRAEKILELARTQ